MQNITKKGFTLIEVLVGTALFVVIAIAAYQAYVSLFTLASVNQYKILAIELADERFEIVRNMPYNSVGILNGIPDGVIPETQTIVRGGVTFTVSTVVRNIDLPFDGLAGSTTDPDTSPADNKLVALTIGCSSCINFSPLTFTTEVAPKNLETASTNGALVIDVFDANGNPVQGASVHVVNNQVTPSIVVDDTTNDSGVLEIVDAATGTNAYNITVTKPGYSTDQTYPPGGSDNPNPAKPDATVLLQQVTPISFSIDKLSSLAVSSVTSSCVSVPNVGFTLVGSKTIDAPELIPKYSATTSTDSTGNLVLNNMEWDSYTFGLDDATYDLAGLNILNPVTLNPNSSSSVLLVVTPKNPDSLLVTVKDSATLLPLTNATATLSNSSGFSSTQVTGQGFFDQTDWSGGVGQSDYSVTNKYWADDGNIDTASPNGDLKLVQTAGVYAPQGSLESSTFDTGSPSHFHSLIWTPSSQPLAAGTSSVEFQIATNATDTATTTWIYEGPDGTGSTYYTSSNSTIGTMHDGDRYFRYKIFLGTQSATNTPDVSDIAFTFTTACTPPGQVIFQGLSPGSYTLNTSAAGDTSSSILVNVSSDWEEQHVILGP